MPTGEASATARLALQRVAVHLVRLDDRARTSRRASMPPSSSNRFQVYTVCRATPHAGCHFSRSLARLQQSTRTQSLLCCLAQLLLSHLAPFQLYHRNTTPGFAPTLSCFMEGSISSWPNNGVRHKTSPERAPRRTTRRHDDGSPAMSSRSGRRRTPHTDAARSTASSQSSRCDAAHCVPGRTKSGLLRTGDVAIGVSLAQAHQDLSILKHLEAPLHYGDPALAPLCRSRSGSYMPIGNSNSLPRGGRWPGGGWRLPFAELLSDSPFMFAGMRCRDTGATTAEYLRSLRLQTWRKPSVLAAPCALHQLIRRRPADCGRVAQYDEGSWRPRYCAFLALSALLTRPTVSGCDRRCELIT